ncbi:MAG: tripartite tricarboxylate transporter permease [Mailhella sp.]|nr:tripartite tricarboxylate transporter permease [Mailhella sp.]
MDILSFVLNGLSACVQPFNILMMLVGLFLGIVGGMLPGINAVTTLALFVPFTFAMSPDTALIALGSIYMGSTYGGSIASVLINTPGQASSIVTALEGYPMTLRGESHRALDLSLGASAFGGVFGGIMLLLFFEPLSNAALKFGSEAFFWMGIFGLSALATLFPGQVLKSLLAGFIGMAISTIGMDQSAGLPRFTMGWYDLIQGLDMVVVMIGLFSISQMFTLIESNEKYIVAESRGRKSFFSVALAILRHPKLLLGSSMLGTFIGIMPGAGGTVASILAYNEARRFSKYPEKFGTGIDDGIIAPESANNSSVGGALVPLLAIGIPGSASAAVIVGGLLAQGLQPGPQMLEKNPDIAYAFIVSIIACSLVMIPCGWVISRCCVKMLGVPRKVIIPVVITLSCVGAYAIRNSLFDVNVMLVSGGIAYVCLKAKIQPASMALGLVLGPIVEENLVTTMMRARSTGSLADLLIFSPLSMLFIVLSVLVLAMPFIMARLKKEQTCGLHCGFDTSAFRRFDFWLVALIALATVPFLRESMTFGPESRIYPLFVYSGILALALLILAMMLFFSTGHSFGRYTASYTHIAVCFAICAACVNLSEFVGFYACMFICIASVIVYLGHTVYETPVSLKSAAWACIAAFLTTAFEYASFTMLLQMDPPAGFLI